MHSWEPGVPLEKQDQHLRPEMATEVWAGMSQYTSLLMESLEPLGHSLVNDKAITGQRQSWIKYKYGNYFQTHFSKSRFLNLDVTGYANVGEEAHQAVPAALLDAHCGGACCRVHRGSHTTGAAKAKEGSVQEGCRREEGRDSVRRCPSHARTLEGSLVETWWRA